MGKRLAVSVHVVNDETGLTEVFGPHRDGGEVPDWAEPKITNPDVWADDTDDDERPRRPRRKATSDDTGDGG